MKHIRVVWKEELWLKKKPATYRQITISPYGEGWIIEGRGDNNIYKSSFCAMNAIDKALGGTGLYGRNLKREKYGIEVIGKKTENEHSVSH